MEQQQQQQNEQQQNEEQQKQGLVPDGINSETSGSGAQKATHENDDDSTSQGGEKAMKRSCLRVQLRKTKMCQHFEKDGCHFGSGCAFAHHPRELQSAPDLRKTRLCPRWAEGRCDRPGCNFAHGEAELRSTDLFFKKTLCIWFEKDKCRAGDQCRFAHGQAELRAKEVGEGGIPSAGSNGHPDGCAEPCKNLWKKRGCKDGASCVRCHLCPKGRKRGRDASVSSEEPQQGGQGGKRQKGSRLDEHGNSRPSWLREDGGNHGNGRGAFGPQAGWDPRWPPPPSGSAKDFWHHPLATMPPLYGWGYPAAFPAALPGPDYGASAGSWSPHDGGAYPSAYPSS